VGQRPVVRGTERRLAVRLVHAEHEGARDAVLLHDSLELFVLPAPPVDVLAEVDVGVEDAGVLRELTPELFVVGRNELMGS
jgi:hypothetical protein